jgi:cytochrome bd-type quinol oxidase subunit 2
MNGAKKALVAIIMTLVFFSIAFSAGVVSVSAAQVVCPEGANLTSDLCKGAMGDSVENRIPRIVNTLLFIVGLLSVIMIIYGGITYVTSAGDQSKVVKAKQTITYAVVGLVVSILAFAIVSFVVGQVTDGGGSGGGNNTSNSQGSGGDELLPCPNDPNTMCAQ